MNYDIACHDLEWYQHGFEDEEIIAGGETKCFVDVAAGETDEGRRYGR